ncbi:MAG TPA: nucleotidyltransferase family protein [Melioribacteraceae bacterium]|nr:nucleotidyltransferase family protein [Melioribacteraceae bacterium]
MKAFILAAGLGTRLKPLTDNKPKALIEVNGITLLEYAIKKISESGFKSIIVNVHHFAGQVIDFLNRKKFRGVEIAVSDESNLLLDTGGGLKNVRWFFSDEKPFLIHNVDIISDINLTGLYKQHLGNNSIATLAVQKRKSSRYFLFDHEKKLCGWKNIKTGEIRNTRLPEGEMSEMAFSGIQIVEPEIFKLMPEESIFSLVDLYLQIANKSRIVYFDHSNSLFLDLGKKEKLTEAEKIIPG